MAACARRFVHAAVSTVRRAHAAFRSAETTASDTARDAAGGGDCVARAPAGRVYGTRDWGLRRVERVRHRASRALTPPRRAAEARLTQTLGPCLFSARRGGRVRDGRLDDRGGSAARHRRKYAGADASARARRGAVHTLTLPLRAQRAGIGIAGATLAFMVEFGSLKSDVSSLDKRMTESNAALHARMTDMSNRMTENNTSLHARMTDTNNHITSLKASVDELLQLGRGNAPPVVPQQPRAEVARAPRGEGTS